MYASLPKAIYLAWKDYVPLRCVHEGELRDFKVKPERKPAGARLVQLPHLMEPLLPQCGAPLNHGEITVGILQHYVEMVRQRKEEALCPLWSWARESEWNEPPAFYPELDLEHVCDRITLIEEKAMELDKDLQMRISSRIAVEHRRRVFRTHRLSNRQADVGRSGAVSVPLAREQEREASNENIRPPRGLGPSGRQNSSLLAPREGEGGSGDGSILRIYPSDAAELNQLLMEVKIRVCQTEDSVLELTVSRDGRALVPGGSEHVSRRDGVELLHAGGLGDLMQAELGHLGERMVLLGNQARGAAVPIW